MILVLGGCGQSGDLRLPEKSSLAAPVPGTVPVAVAGRPGGVEATSNRLAHG